MSVLLSILLLAVCAAFAAGGVVPEGSLNACVYGSCAVGCLVGGRMASVRGKGSGPLSGAAAGLMAALLLGVTGFLLYSGMEPGRCAAVSVCCLFGGVLSGLPGRGGRGKRKHQRA